MAVPEYPIWRFTVKQYHEMIDAGILTDEDPVELLEGWLVTKMPKNRSHTHSTKLTGKALEKIVPSGWYVDTQEPVTTGDSEPEPDVMVVRGNFLDITGRQPLPEEVALVVEVADATLQQDRTLKLRIYANARIPIYWILNLQDRQLEVYTDPTGADEKANFQGQATYRDTDDAPVVIGGTEVARLKVSDLPA